MSDSIALLHLLQPSDALRCMWRRTQLCQYPVVSDQGRRALVHAVAKSVPVHNKLVVGTPLCWLQRRPAHAKPDFN